MAPCPGGLKWAVPVAFVATPAYLFAMSVCATVVDRGGPGYLNVLVLLFAWNAIKFGVAGVLSPLRSLRYWGARPDGSDHHGMMRSTVS
jgi:hypothetical protein